MSEIDRNVFVSHVHKDDDDVGKLKANLSNRDYTIRDYSITADKPNNAQNEEYIKREILAPRINASSVLVVIVSPETKGSQYVNWEIEYAAQKEKRIVGVWGNGAKGCELPDALKDCYDSLVAWDGDKIIKAIEGENFNEEENGNPRPYMPIRPASCSR